MANKGFSHVGLSTLDMDKTRAFYEGILGFKPVIADTIKIKEGGAIRHIFFDTGRDQLLAFMEPRGVPGVPAGVRRRHQSRTRRAGRLLSLCFRGWLRGRTRSQTPGTRRQGRGSYRNRRSQLGKSIYFKDPNGISLEYCCLVREFVADDASMQDRFEISVKALGLGQNAVGEVTEAQSHSYKAKS